MSYRCVTIVNASCKRCVTRIDGVLVVVSCCFTISSMIVVEVKRVEAASRGIVQQ